jgi:glutamine phosphoribosylpyrophosphate amidotransferase
MNNEPRLLGRIRDKKQYNLVVDKTESIKNRLGFLCSLEAIYFMKKDTLLFNANTTVNNFRRCLGVELGKQEIYKLANILNPTNPYIYEYDARQVLKKKVVLYIPESAYGIAQGYSDILETWIRNDLISKVQNIRSFKLRR